MNAHIIHDEFDKLVIMHEVNRSDLLSERKTVGSLIHSMAAHGLKLSKRSRGVLLFKGADITLGITSAYGWTMVTGMIRTEALHLNIAAAHTSLESAMNAVPWVDDRRYVRELHPCADVVGVSIQDGDLARFEDHTGWPIETRQPRKSRSGKRVSGGATFYWGPHNNPRIVIYDKVAELNRHRQKAGYMKPLYRRYGWDGKEPITRIEIRPSKDDLAGLPSMTGQSINKLWQDYLGGLRFTDGPAHVPVEKRPTADWWDNIMKLSFLPPWKVDPMPPQIRTIPLKQAAKQAQGSAVGSMAKIMVIHELGHPDHPPLDAAQAQEIVACGSGLDAAFSIRVADKALEMGLTRLDCLASTWPLAFKVEVMRQWP